MQSARARFAALLTALCGGAAGCLIVAPPALAAIGWTTPQRFTRLVAPADVLNPQAAIASDGTSVVAWRSQGGALVVTTGTPTGRFAAPQTIPHRFAGVVVAMAVAAGPGGAALIAWNDDDGVGIAARRATGHRFAVRRAYAPTGAKFGPLDVAAEPSGGWLVATSGVFPSAVPAPKPVIVTFAQATLVTLSLDPAGRAAAPVQVLGPGVFDGLAVDPGGRATLALSEPQLTFPFAPGPVLVSRRPRGGVFGTASAVPGPATGAHVAVGPGGRAVVSVIRTDGCPDNFCAGAPAVDILTASGGTGPVFGPSVDPRRASAATAALTSGGDGVLVFLLNTKPAASARRAAVLAVAFAGDGTIGPVQTLTPTLASAPFVMSVGSGQVLALWSGTRAIGAALAGRGGRFSTTAAPSGPPPSGGGFGGTMETSGRYAVFAWPSRGVVLASVRRF